MPKKNILALIGILVVIAIALVVYDNSNTSKKDALVGQSLFESSQASNVTSILVKKESKVLDLKKDKLGGWRIAGNGDESFPASAQKVVELFDNLANAKITRKVSSKKEKWQTLQLTAEQGLTVTILSGEKKLVEVVLGKNRPKGGQYLRKIEESSSNSYLLDKNLNIQFEKSAWELKTLVDLKPELIKSIRFNGNGKPFTVARENKDGKFSPTELQQDQEADTSKQSQLERTFVAFSFSERLPKANNNAIKFAETPTAELETFEGDIYKITIFEKKPPVTKKAKKDKEQKQDTAKFFAHISMKNGSTATAAKASLLNELMDQWYFEIEKYQADKFTHSVEDFVKKKTGDKKPQPKDNKG